MYQSCQQTDFDLLSLALELNGTIITDDFAVQNVATETGDYDHADSPAVCASEGLEIPLLRMRALLSKDRGMSCLRLTHQKKT